MVKTWELPNIQQCATCPWIQQNSVDQIPDYNPALHQELESTIASSNVNQQLANLAGNKSLKIMACHYSTATNNLYCIGWLVNQLGVGNNIPLRLAMRGCQNIGAVKLRGKQKRSFTDTFE